MYNNDEGDAVVINANYAIDAGLNPTKDPIAVESGENNPYANIITVHQADVNKPEIVALVKVLHSKTDSGLYPREIPRRGDPGQSVMVTRPGKTGPVVIPYCQSG